MKDYRHHAKWIVDKAAAADGENLADYGENHDLNEGYHYISVTSRFCRDKQNDIDNRADGIGYGKVSSAVVQIVHKRCDVYIQTGG